MNKGIDIAGKYSTIRQRLDLINHDEDDLLKSLDLLNNKKIELLEELCSLKKKYPELIEQLEKEHD